MSKEADKNLRFIPRDVLPDHVIGLVEALYSLGGSADPMHIGDITSESIDVLPKAIDVAEALNLLRYENGYLYITELGRKVAEANAKKLKKILREIVLLNRIEPLYEIYTILKERRAIPVEEFKNIVEKHYRRINRDVIKNVLVWGAYLELFKMSEDDSQIVLIHD
ncbi:MAG: AAA-associated domain-containing protein [Ignisphaera sp.]